MRSSHIRPTWELVFEASASKTLFGGTERIISGFVELFRTLVKVNKQHTLNEVPPPTMKSAFTPHVASSSDQNTTFSRSTFCPGHKLRADQDGGPLQSKQNVFVCTRVYRMKRQRFPFSRFLRNSCITGRCRGGVYRQLVPRSC